MTEREVVAIIDAGLGNIASIRRIITKIGGEPVLVTSPSQLDGVRKVVLPGVGHFDEGIRRLRERGFADALGRKESNRRHHLLGICLGMQLLCRGSAEGDQRGLGLIDADVKKFSFNSDLQLKVPHMGWNVVIPCRDNPLLHSGNSEERFYFVHSYKVVPDDPSVVIGTTNYGGDFCAAFQSGTIFGVQFHPEKSHRFGMALFRRFIEL